MTPILELTTHHQHSKATNNNKTSGVIAPKSASSAASFPQKKFRWKSCTLWGFLIIFILVLYEWLGDIILLQVILYANSPSQTNTKHWSTTAVQHHRPAIQYSSTTNNRQLSEQHVVFIGDSLLRNAYLEWVDQIHFHRSSSSSTSSSPHHYQSNNLSTASALMWAPKELIDENQHENWIYASLYTIGYFQGYMSCDCRRSQSNSYVLGWNHHVDNRYYSNDFISITYLQGYGDYGVHGRYLPEQLSKAQPSFINPEDIVPNHKNMIQWKYQGLQYDQFMINYISKLIPLPTTIVMNAGDGILYPNYDISLNMGRILWAAKRVIGEQGIIIWRETKRSMTTTSPDQSQYIGSLSPADQAAKEWSYRIPGVLYQSFPNNNNNSIGINSSFQNYSSFHNSPQFYRIWNEHLNDVVWEHQPPHVEHMAFIIVGAIRSLALTHYTMMENFVRRLCPPYQCVTHLILHLSDADNRPNRAQPDPMGVAMSSKGHANKKYTTYFQHPDQYNWPKDYLYFHYVNESYEIGSLQEQIAMDQYEREYIQEHTQFHSTTTNHNDPPSKAFDSTWTEQEILRRFHLIRFGDPRRYSMWFARAWAWRYVKKLSLSFHYYIFTRPDLLWYMSLPTINFFRDFAQSDQDIWVHDRYYNDVPDTFALLPNQDVAEKYLSLRYLLHPDVFCLGGPGFDRSIVEQRLSRMNGTVHNETDWCMEEDDGWSEMILRKKLDRAHLNKRWFPAGVTIWRPPEHSFGLYGIILCEPVHVDFVIGWVRFRKTNLPYWGCLFANYAIQSNWKRVGRNPSLITKLTRDGVLLVDCFRWRSRDTNSKGYCLSRIKNNRTNNEDDTNYPHEWISEPCIDDPFIPAGQIYAKLLTNNYKNDILHDIYEQHWLGINVQTGGHVISLILPDMDQNIWFPEPIHLYHSYTLVDVSHSP